VVKRNEQERLRGVKRISASQLDAAAAARYAVFEYMISNLDWAMTAGPAGADCCHNARLMGAKGVTGASTGLIPVLMTLTMPAWSTRPMPCRRRDPCRQCESAALSRLLRA